MLNKVCPDCLLPGKVLTKMIVGNRFYKIKCHNLNCKTVNSYWHSSLKNAWTTWNRKRKRLIKQQTIGNLVGKHKIPFPGTMVSSFGAAPELFYITGQRLNWYKELRDHIDAAQYTDYPTTGNWKSVIKELLAKEPK